MYSHIGGVGGRVEESFGDLGQRMVPLHQEGDWWEEGRKGEN